MTKFKIAVLVGSLRRESWNRKMANALIKSASDSLSLEIINIGQLPFYNEDLEDTPPIEWIDFRKQLASFDGVLFVTPEYNRSVPAVLKNAIDVGSRPYGKSCWNGKPGAIISVSPGNIGAFGANHHLRQSLVFLNVPAMAQPEAYISAAAKLFDANGALINESTQEFLNNFLKAFTHWMDNNAEKK